MFRGRHRAFRRAAWLALLALFLQTVVPLVHHPAKAASLPDGIAANLCIAPGSPPAPSPSDTGKSPAHGAPTCPICQTLHMLGAGFVPPSSLAVAPASLAGRAPLALLAAAVLDGRAVSQARARAPPQKA